MCLYPQGVDTRTFAHTGFLLFDFQEDSIDVALPVLQTFTAMCLTSLILLPFSLKITVFLMQPGGGPGKPSSKVSTFLSSRYSCQDLQRSHMHPQAHRH